MLRPKGAPGARSKGQGARAPPNNLGPLWHLDLMTNTQTK